MNVCYGREISVTAEPIRMAPAPQPVLSPVEVMTSLENVKQETARNIRNIAIASGAVLALILLIRR